MIHPKNSDTRLKEIRYRIQTHSQHHIVALTNALVNLIKITPPSEKPSPIHKGRKTQEFFITDKTQDFFYWDSR